MTENTPAEIREQYASHESHIRGIAPMYFLTAALFIIGAFAPRTSLDSNIFFACVAAVLIVIALGLLKLRRWTRIPAAIISALGTFFLGFLFVASAWERLFLVCMVFVNSYFLFLLVCRKGGVVFSKRYQQVIQESANMELKYPFTMWVVTGIAICTGGGMIIASRFR